MSRWWLGSVLAVWLTSGLGSGLFAAEPFRYPEGRHGKGELKYLQGVPVLVVEGTPAEVGEQVGVLAVKPAAALLGQLKEFLKAHGLEGAYPLLLKTGTFMVPQFPPDHLEELEAVAKSSGRPLDFFIFGNTVPDLMNIGGCSALLVEPSRSAAGGPLFGRNLDWRPFLNLHEHTLVVVYRTKGKRAFASVSYPGMIGCSSAINDAGLALATLEVTATADGAPRFNPAGTPYMLYLRRVMEECTTVEEAGKLIRSLKRTTLHNVALCDRRRGVVLEITPRNVMVRPAVEGLCACTNHFRTKGLAASTQCRRYEALEKAAAIEKLTLADVARHMDAVHQGVNTVQTMVFELAARKLHLAFGPGPATRLPLKTLELTALFER